MALFSWLKKGPTLPKQPPDTYVVRDVIVLPIALPVALPHSRIRMLRLLPAAQIEIHKVKFCLSHSFIHSLDFKVLGPTMKLDQ